MFLNSANDKYLFVKNSFFRFRLRFKFLSKYKEINLANIPIYFDFDFSF